MMEFGEGIFGVWGWLGVTAQGTAGAAEATLGAAPDFPFWTHLVRVGAILSAMLGVLVLGLYLWKRWGLLRPQGTSPLIQVLATHHLSPKKALLLVAVGKERLLLASSGEQLQLLASLSPEDGSIGALQEGPEPSFKLALKNELEGRG